MKTVRDIFVEAVALKAQGVPPHAIAERIVQIGHDNGFADIDESGSGGRGEPLTISVRFPNGEEISYDGASWSHIRRELSYRRLS